MTDSLFQFNIGVQTGSWKWDVRLASPTPEGTPPISEEGNAHLAKYLNNVIRRDHEVPEGEEVTLMIFCANTREMIYAEVFFRMSTVGDP